MKINTLYELLRHGVEKFASRTAFDMFNGESVTYAEVGRRAAAVQEALVGAGVKAGDKVALLSSSMPNWGNLLPGRHLGRHGRGTDPSRLLRPRTGYDHRPFRGESPAGLGQTLFQTFEADDRFAQYRHPDQESGDHRPACHGNGIYGGSFARRPGGDHLYVGNDVEPQGRNASPTRRSARRSIWISASSRSTRPTSFSRCCRCPIPTNVRSD